MAFVTNIRYVLDFSENSSVLETLPVPYGAFVCFVLFEEGRICRPLWCTFSGRGVPKMTNRRSVILIEFGKSVNQVDVCAQNRLGALLSSRFHSLHLHLSQQFKDDPILKLEVLIKALSLLISCVVSRVNFMTIFSSMPLSLSQKIKFAHYWLSDMGRKTFGIILQDCE